MHSTRSRTLSRRLGVNLVAAAALVAGAAACGDDDDSADEPAATADAPAATEAPADTASEPTAGAETTVALGGDVESFCQAELEVEAAVMSEDPALIGPALEAIAAAAPAEIKPAVDTAVEAASAGEEDTPEFETAYGEMIDYVKGNCGFGELALTGSEYAFGGIPESLDAGPVVVTFENTGAEFHEVFVARVNDGVTETADELLALSEEEAFSKITPAGAAFAAPGETGNTVLDLQPGRHIAICFLPEGTTPENMPAIESGEHEGAPHAMLGMVQEFEVSS